VTSTLDWKKTEAGDSELARMQARAAAARMEKKHVSLPKNVQKAAANMIARARESLKVSSSSKAPAPPKCSEDEVVKQFNISLVTEERSAMKRDLPPLTLSLWDYGGQEVFYTLHHVILSEKGIYTVVFENFNPIRTHAAAAAFNVVLLIFTLAHLPGWYVGVRCRQVEADLIPSALSGRLGRIGGWRNALIGLSGARGSRNGVLCQQLKSKNLQGLG